MDFFETDKESNMGRPREFSEDEAIEAAMCVFWDRGYEATALPHLLQAMKLTRGSFYKAFTSKHAVYLLALRRYDAQVIAPVAKTLKSNGGGTGRRNIRELFLRIEKIAKSKLSARGCFLCKAAIDRAPHDKNVAREVRKTIRMLENAFAFALAPDKRAEKKAAQLTGVYLGIQVLRNARENVSTITAIVNQTIEGLG